MVLFPPPFYFFFFISQTSYRTYKIISSYELARPIMGTIFLVKNYVTAKGLLRIADILYIYYIIIVHANFVLITRKEGGAVF